MPMPQFARNSNSIATAPFADTTRMKYFGGIISLEKIIDLYLTANSPARGKSPRRSRSMSTVTDRQSTGDDNVRFHDRQTWPTLARSTRLRWLNICVSISSGSWSHISRLQLGSSSSQTVVGLISVVRRTFPSFFNFRRRISLIALVKNDRSQRTDLKYVS